MGESKSTITVQTENQLFVDFNFEKVFIGDNTFEVETLTNISGGDLTFEIGTLLGRITASGKVQPLASAAVDGSEIPVGVLAQTIFVADASDEVITMAVSGEVDRDLVVLDGADTMDTIIDGRPIKDRIAGDTLGIKLITATEITLPDNS